MRIGAACTLAVLALDAAGCGGGGDGPVSVAEAAELYSNGTEAMTIGPRTSRFHGRLSEGVLTIDG